VYQVLAEDELRRPKRGHWQALQPMRGVTMKCENCEGVATVYAMGAGAGDWAGRYCATHIPQGFTIVKYYEEVKQ
jgi:hypothetical protein